jgi:hypothetical protein
VAKAGINFRAIPPTKEQSAGANARIVTGAPSHGAYGSMVTPNIAVFAACFPISDMRLAAGASNLANIRSRSTLGILRIRTRRRLIAHIAESMADGVLEQCLAI